MILLAQQSLIHNYEIKAYSVDTPEMIPVRLSIALKHLFTVHLVNNFEYSTIQYEM